jgi:phospholipase/carboxylesterase
MSAGIDLLAHRVRGARAKPDGALVLLHGRGTDELDLQPLLEELDPQRRLVGVTPRAPLALPGLPGAHWYVVPRVGYPDPTTFFASFQRLGAWLDSLPAALGPPRSRTVLGGFSMGAVMSYALGLGRGRRAPAGIIALSGFIPTVDGLELDLQNRQGYPVAIGHGTQDNVIPVEFARSARERLTAAGADVLYRETPMLHTIDPEFVPVLRSWLADRLPPAGNAREEAEHGR